MLLTNRGKGLSQDIVDGCFTATDGTDSHKTVTHKRSFVQLDDLNEPLGSLNQVVGFKESLNGCLDFLVDLFGNVGLSWEDISNKRLEKRLILGDELGEVHISQGTCDKHFLISVRALGTLDVTGSTEH